MQDFVETVAAANPLARIFIGSIIPMPETKQQTLEGSRSSTWSLGRKSQSCARKGSWLNTLMYISCS